MRGSCSTHYMDEAEYCDRVALLHRGRIVAMGRPEELGGADLGVEILEIAVDRPVEALERLGREEVVREVALFGTTLHVAVSDAATAAPRLGAALAASSIRVDRVERIRPSLEDVFVALIEAQGRSAAARGRG